MSKGTCETCRWVSARNPTAPKELHPMNLVCRIRAPAPSFPFVNPYDWCGEHAPTPPSAEMGNG